MLAPFSTLFPYTTLFRSSLLNCLARFFVGGRTVLGFVDAGNLAKIVGKMQAGLGDGLNGRLSYISLRLGKDRKSTRLNSSHTVISYAVFCLKKKNRKGSQVRRVPRFLRLAQEARVDGGREIHVRVRIVAERQLSPRFPVRGVQRLRARP